jgi:hypothetical protein
VASVSPNPTSGPQAVTAVVDGVPVMLPFGRARWDEPFVQIELASAPLSCDPDAPQDSYLLSFLLPAGPGRRFYAGQCIELPGEIVTRARASGRPRVTIEVEGASAEEGWARGRPIDPDWWPRSGDASQALALSVCEGDWEPENSRTEPFSRRPETW